jgi:hypothetical protein
MIRGVAFCFLYLLCLIVTVLLHLFGCWLVYRTGQFVDGTFFADGFF